MIRTNLLFVLLGSICGVVAIPAWAQLPELAQTPSLEIPEQVQSPSYDVSGQVNWLLRYGLGDPQGLAQKTYSSGLFFSQAITLDADISVPVERPIPGLLSLTAHLDNEQPEFLQSLHMLWQAEGWSAEFGDFPMGRPGSPFASSSRLLKGFRVNGQLSERVTLSGIYSQVSGILQSRTFRGNTVEERVTFAFHPENQPFLDQPYLKNLSGLEYFALGGTFVEGFTRVKLSFRSESRLQELLVSYDLGYVYETIREDPERELDSSVYAVIPTGEEYFLALRSEFKTLLRDRLREYIDDYNQDQLLTGDERKEYPLSEGTEYERAFLERLSDLVKLTVDSLSRAPKESQHQRFYVLGQDEIQEDSVRIEVKVDDEFTEILDPKLADYEYKVYADIGILEFNFPEEFFQNRESAVRVTYSYQSGSGTYVLGLSILKGSEKVYLNGQLLQPNVDYLIEYEVGFLILLKSITSDDVLRIEYEIARGGLGGARDYSQNFQGLTLSYVPFEGLSVNIDLLNVYDSARPDINRETLQTMPNTHTVLGISGQLNGPLLQGDFDLGFTINQFPPDDNLRVNQPNRIYVIRAIEHYGRTLILFGHRNGLQVYDGQDWHGYGIFEGLAGLTVYDIAAAPGQLVFATSAGISRLKLDPGDPLASFARRSNWTNFTQQDGLPGNTIYAVLVEGDTLWVGTDKGLAEAPLDGLSEENNWRLYQKSEHPEMLSDRIFQLAAAQGQIYVGTDQGLMIFDPATAAFQVTADLRGARIYDLATDGEVVYAATDWGVRALEGGQGLGWPVADQAVHALAPQGDNLWYGTPEGLYSRERGLVSETRGREITAIGASQGAIWAGEAATTQYVMMLYQIDSASDGVLTHPQTETRLDGRAKDRFTDIPASEHTDYGWIGRIRLTKQLGPLQLQGTLEGLSPRFTAIGTLDRQDRVQFNLGASYPIGPAVQVRANHQEGLQGLFSFPSQVIQDSVGLTLKPDTGPQIDLDYSLQRVNQNLRQVGFDRLERSYNFSARERFFDDRLSLTLGYELSQSEDLQYPVYSSVESQLSGEAAFQALQGLTLRLGYRQPTNWRFGQALGERRLDWGADGTTVLTLGTVPLTFRANYQGNSRFPLTAFDLGSLEQSGGLVIRALVLQLGGLSLSPQASFSARSSDLFGPNANLQLSGEGTVQGRFSDLEGRLYYKRTSFSYGRSQLERIADNVRFSLNYQGFPSLRPTLEFSGNLETLLHPLLGQRTNGQYQISLQLSWHEAGPLGMDLYLAHQLVDSDRERTASYSLQQSLEYNFLPGLTPRLEFQVEYLEGQEQYTPVDELRGEVSLSGNFSLVEEWGATLSATYLFGLDAIQPRGSYQSFVLTFQAGRAFSLF